MVQFNCDTATQAWREHYTTMPDAPHQVASIKLVINASGFEAEAGEPLTDQMLAWLAILVSEQVQALPGYGGWEIGWVTCPTIS